MALSFEWDPRKASSNLLKHGVSFKEAASAFGDPRSITIEDPTHSQDEIRWLLLGVTDLDRVVVVVHTLRGENVRIISARLASTGERRAHEEEGS